MLQFLIKPSERYSALRQAQMALKGGCGWIEIDPRDLDAADGKEKLGRLIDLCRRAEAILTVAGDVKLADELKIHGVHLYRGDLSPADARNELGPHAIIGVDVPAIEDILALRGLDVDYVTIQVEPKTMDFEQTKRSIEKLRGEGVKLPVVAEGNISLDDITILKGIGFNGIATNRPIVDSADPEIQTREFLKLLEQ